MDKPIRNQIQKATQDARALLETEFSEQLEGIFDIHPDGTIAPEPGAHLDADQRIVRQKIVAAIAHEKAGGMSDRDAVAAYLREGSFTCLNRFVALKMLEARDLTQQCISRGELSSGFKEFCGLAPGLAELPDRGYRLYIESLFDELSTEIRVLFDRQSPASLLWPRKNALDGLLSILNRQELEGIWGEDETIGWTYQYFNSADERKKMRDESAAPRNSHELAVRNQFFTPRYVVEFLTDNTLGRIWYEMRKGDSALKQECRYLVRRPNEVFLAMGEKAPQETEDEGNLSQEELLKKTVYIEHRSKKDPRDLRILDPACGSGHFLLYAFDLLERIYEEAWAEPDGPKYAITGRALCEDFETLDALFLETPKLISPRICLTTLLVPPLVTGTSVSLFIPRLSPPGQNLLTRCRSARLECWSARAACPPKRTVLSVKNGSSPDRMRTLCHRKAQLRSRPSLIRSTLFGFHGAAFWWTTPVLKESSFTRMMSFCTAVRCWRFCGKTKPMTSSRKPVRS